MESHREKPLELYYIDIDGNWNKVSSGYKAIGNGSEMADMFCGKLELDKTMTMKEFIKHTYVAIMYMDKYCPGLGVGVEPKGIPDITYLYYNEEWDKKTR